ncbi:MAG TPA: SWIM zinc finger family protein [Trebonia sp.]|nr:SWIM zinc finger family protein [Trebonia sp.]
MSPRQPRWWEYEQSGPIAVEGGIKARSKRGAIGEQWWSQRFLAVLESYGMSGRLQRGRSYARRGQVIEFSLGTGKVTARVQGSRPQPYNVSITVLPLTSAQWREVESRLASQALFRARLLAGEMPAEIEEVFAACGTPLFPRSSADLEMRCSCPDWGVPCKHLAAVCYVLAESFDDDPFEMLAWRGKGRDELLAALRGKSPRSAGSPVAPGGGVGQGAAGASPWASPVTALLADVTGPPLEECLADFWSPGLSQARLRALPASPAAPPDLLLRLADPPPVLVRGAGLREILAPAYARLGEQSGEAVQEE